MFLSLFAKECKQISRSLVYFIFLLVFLMFMGSQLGATEIIQKPKLNQEDYGTKLTLDKNEIMSATLADLVLHIGWNSFATYPTGFYKQVIVSEKELKEMKHIVEECTGKSWNTIMKEQDRHFAQYKQETAEDSMAAQSMYRVDPDTSLTYDKFKEQMEKICKIIGKGSSFEKESYSRGVDVPMSYEDALEEYNELIENDGITEAYMRLFCDYAGITLCMLPIFMGVTRCVRDKRSKVQQVIYTRKAKAFTIVLSRYLANVVMMLVPILILAFALETPYLYQAQTLGVKPHYLAFLEYSVVWLLPTILFVLAVSFLLTELLNGIGAIVIQVFMGMSSIMTVTTLMGDFRWNLVPRWNCFGCTQQYLRERTELYQNRMLYTLLAIVCILLSVVLYEYKRKGGLHFHEKKR